MNSKIFLTLAALLFIGIHVSVAHDDPEMSSKLQFSSMFMGTNNGFEKLKGEKYSEDENWVYYGSDYGLGQRATAILKRKKNASVWYLYI